MKRNMMQNTLHEVEKDCSSTAIHWAASARNTTFFLPNLNEHKSKMYLCKIFGQEGYKTAAGTK